MNDPEDPNMIPFQRVIDTAESDTPFEDYDNIVVYHSPCQDGWMSAVLARICLGERTVFLPRNYDNPFVGELTMLNFMRGKNVYILDFSIPIETLKELDVVATKVVVCDHHKTAKEMYADTKALGLKNTRIHFDLERCGAQITWSVLSPGFKTIPRYPVLVNYVADRDLWKWKLRGSRALNSFLSIQPQTFDRWTELLDTVERMLDEYVEAGLVVQAAINVEVDKLARRAHQRNIAGYCNTPVVNTQSYHSETGERLLALNPAAAFAATYFDKDPDTRIWSLRTRASGPFDVSAVAKKFGGGGHKDAAGFTTRPETKVDVPPQPGGSGQVG